MPAEKVAMRKVKEVVRLREECGLSQRQIAQSCPLSRTTVAEYLRRVTVAGLTWPLIAELDERVLEQRLFPAKLGKPPNRRMVPDWASVHQELKRKGVTLFLLWEEYKAVHPAGYQYSWFCQSYRAWARKLDVVWRQEHRAGEKLFGDYAGQTVPVQAQATGTVRAAQILVAVLGASSYTYAEATWSQPIADWMSSHSRAFAFFGGVPDLVVPDNLKSGVAQAHRYEPVLNRTSQDLATHYGVAIVPARAGKPRDKAKVESGGLVVERWILARLRHQTFLSLADLNTAIRPLLEHLNQRPFKKLPGSRHHLFVTVDQPALKPLPATPYEYAEWKQARVNILCGAHRYVAFKSQARSSCNRFDAGQRIHYDALGNRRTTEKATAMTTKARTGQQRGRTSAQEEQALIELLSGGLSDEEIQRVLACALLVLEKPGLDQLITRLGEETGGTLRSLLESRHASHRKSPQQSLPIAGSAKIHQEWEKTWREWHACITESGDEKGKYILQEHHWEEPYLDTSALAEDLELIAARMRPLLARVMDEELDPDFGFANEIGLTVEEIGLGLPEWMDPSQYEGCAFGPEVTGCLLEWEWRAAQRDEMSAFEFVDTIRQLEHEANGISFNQDTISTFILECDEVAQRGILQGIVAHRNAPHWEYVLGSPYSGWFLLYQELCQRWDPALYLDSCRQNIARDWELALPVITDLLDQQAFAEAQPFVEQAVRALLQLKEGETWNPHEALLIYHLTRQYSGERNVRLVPLFESWIKITQALGQEEQTYALQLQLSLCQQWEDWDAAFAAFQKLPASKLTGIRDRLFADWRALVVDASLGSRYDRLESPQVTWVHGLVDAAWAGNKGAAVFRRAMQEWLKEIVRTPAALQQSLDALGQLTLDLDADSQLRKTAPTLHGLLSSSLWVDNTTVGASRRRWIERLGAAALFPEVLTFWKRHAARLIPDPAQASGSNYDHCAEWLAAFSELDTQAAEKILQEWSATHHRRRNLWKALAARGLQRVDTA